MLPEATLSLTVPITDGHFGRPLVRSGRVAGAAAVFRGRTPEQALSLLPLLYSLCGTAQQVAGVMACEAALGITVSPRQALARRVVVTAEALSEQCLLILRDWPTLCAAAPVLEVARTVRASLLAVAGQIFSGPWGKLGGVRLNDHAGESLAATLRVVRQTIETVIFNGSDPVPMLADLDSLRRWAVTADGPAAQMLRVLDHGGLNGFGACAVPFLDPAARASVARRLGEDATSFAAFPDLNGQAAETGPVARRRTTPAVDQALRQHGRGLLARSLAHLADVAACLSELEDAATALCDTDSLSSRPASPPTETGFAWVEAARGLLAHRVEIEDGHVARWHILAPTEWTFHPDGALVQGLEDAPCGDDPERRVRLLVAALDPCVACTIKVTADA